MAYFPTTKWTPIGIARFIGAEIVGWKLSFRTTNGKLQRYQYNGISRFGALRAVMARCRAWHGKVFILDIESCEPVYHAHYETDD
jgi:hypothetical protein